MGCSHHCLRALASARFVQGKPSRVSFSWTRLIIIHRQLLHHKNHEHRRVILTTATPNILASKQRATPFFEFKWTLSDTATE